MKYCYDCRKEISPDRFRCDSCVKEIRTEDKRRSRPMTEWEALKLQFYKSDRAWEENIRSRQTVVKNGKSHVVYRDNHGNMRPLPTPHG